MIRTFHGVGQGGFSTEFFKNFNVVYDCGSETNLNLIKKEIKATFEPREKIDAVFISHLHNDHINGLEYLLKYCKVRRLFLPLIDSNEKIQLLIHNSIHGKLSEFIINLITNPLDYINKEDTQVILVPPVEDNKEFELTPLNFNEIRYDERILKRNAKLIDKNLKNWVFIPFNFQKSKRSKILRKELEKRNIDMYNVSDFESLWGKSKTRELIKDAYKCVPGGFNTNSLTLYSGPNIDVFSHMGLLVCMNYFHRPIKQNYCCELSEPGCLYFGDYDAKGVSKWKEIYNRYKSFWDHIGIVQIPHHGSCHNYNKNINRIKPMISVIFAGYSNKYRHPHSSTIRNIIIDKGLPFIVNENIGSNLQFQILGI